MSRQSIGSAESLFLGAQVASDLQLAGVVDGVLVPRQVVWPREDGAAWLASAGVDSVTTMRSGLGVEQIRSHAQISTTADALRLPVAFSLVFL